MSPQLEHGSCDIVASLSRALLHARSDAVIATDSHGSITFWNPGAERIFGFPPEEALGRSLDLIIPESLRERHWQGYRRAMELGESRYGEGDLLSVPALRKDGQRISVEFTIVMLRDDAGTVRGIGATLRDVTKRFEELKALRRKLADGPAAA